MAARPPQQPWPTPLSDVDHPLASLPRSWLAAPEAELATQAAHQVWPPVDALARWLEGEADGRRDRAPQRRIRLARFPVITTVEQGRWDWPTRMQRLQGQPPCHLACLQDPSTLIVLGGVGLAPPGHGAGLCRGPPGPGGALGPCA